MEAKLPCPTIFQPLFPFRKPPQYRFAPSPKQLPTSTLSTLLRISRLKRGSAIYKFSVSSIFAIFSFFCSLSLSRTMLSTPYGHWCRITISVPPFAGSSIYLLVLKPPASYVLLSRVSRSKLFCCGSPPVFCSSSTHHRFSQRPWRRVIDCTHAASLLWVLSSFAPHFRSHLSFLLSRLIASL